MAFSSSTVRRQCRRRVPRRWRFEVDGATPNLARADHATQAVELAFEGLEAAARARTRGA